MTAPLLTALLTPDRVAGYDAATWTLVLRQAWQLGLAGKLAARIGNRPDLPASVRRQLAGAARTAERNAAKLWFEVDRLERVLPPLECEPVLLKGAAYLVAGRRPAAGRLASDIDILVAAADLDRVEAAMLAEGWESTTPDAYDQRYYRTWMHELPPLWHRDRDMVADIHHTILPRTARLTPDAASLLAAARASGRPGWRVLCPTDMVLHTAIHLFHDGDLGSGLRDLLDLGDLMTELGDEPGFWPDLAERAEHHGVGRPLFYAVRYCRLLLPSQFPDAPDRSLAKSAPPAPILWLMDRLFLAALIPTDPDRVGFRVRISRRLLYIRSHWLRMPPWQLAVHLARKAVRGGSGHDKFTDRR